MFPYILLHERQSHIEGQILQHMKLEVLCWRTAMLIISLLSVDLKGKNPKDYLLLTFLQNYSFHLGRLA